MHSWGLWKGLVKLTAGKTCGRDTAAAQMFLCILGWLAGGNLRSASVILLAEDYE